MGIRVQVCLRDSVTAALQDDGDAEDIESLVFEKVPGDLPRPVRAGG